MSVLDAVATVLAEAGAPLNCREITRQVLDRHLWTARGRTPETTVRGQLAVDISTLGERSRFERIAPGVFRMRDAAATAPTPLPGLAAPAANGVAEPARRMTFADAAEDVLRHFAGRQPMHYRAITAKALELGLVSTNGLTPAASLYSQVLTEIARHTRRGQTPRFVQHGDGLVGLSEWLPSGIIREIEAHNAGVRREMRKHLLEMPSADFEALVGELFAKLGLEEVATTKSSGDAGIEVRGTLVAGDLIRVQMAVQVKRWRNNVQANVVRSIRGSLRAHERGAIVTTSDFSPGARAEAAAADAAPIALLNGKELVNLLVSRGIGIQQQTYALLTLGDSPT